MTTPYWGTLPKSSSSVRRSSGEAYDHRQPDSSYQEQSPIMDSAGSSQPHPRQNRASVQTARTSHTESTMSPFVSPTTSNFPDQGLAPRPPSMPYDASQHPDFAERRQRRRSRKSEELDLRADAPTPPAAPDVPRAPPISYKDPYSGGAGPSYGPPRGSRQAGPSANAEEYYQDGARGRSIPGGAATSQPKKAPVTRRVSAKDRSPLQQLEVTLSKEEKRARAEAAERRAREKATGTNPDLLQPDAQSRSRPQAQQGSQPQSQVQPIQQQVRFTEKKRSFEEGDEPARGILMPSTAVPSRTASKGQRGQPAQASVEDNRRQPMDPQQRSRATAYPDDTLRQEHNQGVPQRNLSFRERAVQNDLKLPATTSHNGHYMQDSPQPTPPITGQASEPTKSGFSLTRSGSNKLRKEPPGDPWYSQRMQMEKKHGNVGPRDAEFSSQPAAAEVAAATVPRSMHGSLREKPLPPEPYDDGVYGQNPSNDQPRTGGMPSKAAKLMGFGGIQRRATAPTSRASSYDEYDAPRQQQAPQPTSGRMAAVAASQGPPRHDPRAQQEQEGDLFDEELPVPARGSQMMYAKRGEQIGPGRGLFQPPRYLEEWKTGTVGLLGGAQLELTEEQLAVVDKNTPWWEGGGGRRRSSVNSRPRNAEAFDGEYDETANEPTRFKPHLYLKCGPLLRYCGIRHEKANPRMRTTTDRDIWRGSVMIVTKDSESSYDIAPTLRLFVQPLELLPSPPHEISGDKHLPPEYVDPIAGIPKLGRRGETLYVRPVEHLQEAKDLSKDETDDGLFEQARSLPDYPLPQGATELPGSYAGRRKRSAQDGEKVSKYKDVRGFRLHAERGCTFWRFNIEVELRDKQQRIAYRINRGPATGFWVPARNQSMNIMFHSCNGFSMSVNPDDLSGPDPMWRDVLNTHQTQPFHVMLGGGDQIYNDCLIGQSELFNEWLEIRNPLHKRKALFTPAMQDQLETLYLERYCTWFSQGLFGLANSQIPMVNMWDDHDISDGYGSYPHMEQNCPAFSGLGAVAFKYYMLFQHQSVPTEMEEDEPSWLLGHQPGPYIRELSRSLYMSLGAKVALLAVDARTERTETEVVSEDTWRVMMDRCYNEIKSGTTEHLLVLLGVPIAYPRLVWLENILTSRLMDPVKAMGKLGLLGNALNRIDGGVEVMDDLNDHWTAKNHKRERRFVIEDLQDLAADKSVRITILSGDVHLAAVGQFYANPKLGLAKHKDFRYMPNVISSAIANTPPPNMLADVLNKRNKVHHFDDNTEESMIPLFTQGVDGKSRNNKHLLPHRNWCSIREWTPGTTPPPTPPIPGYDGVHNPPTGPKAQGGILRRLSKNRPETARGRDSRPPVSGESRIGGLIRRLSSRGRKPSTDPQEPPPPQLARTMSLNRGDFGPRSFFGRKPSRGRPDDGGINGQWGDSDTGEEEYYDAYDEPRSPPTPPRDAHLRLRGGSGRPPALDEFSPGDEDYFTTSPPARAPQQSRQQQPAYQDTPPEPPVPIRPFHRTPTGLSVKQMKKPGAEKFNVDLEGGLDITLNVEVNPRDPAGITVPYRLLVPRLFWDEAKDGAALQRPAPTGFKRFLSFRKKPQQQRQQQGTGDGGLQPQQLSHSVPASQEEFDGGGEEGWGGDASADRLAAPQQVRQLQQRPVQQQQQQQQQQWHQPLQQQPPQQRQSQQQPVLGRAGASQPPAQQHRAPQRYHYPQQATPQAMPPAQQQQQQQQRAPPPAGRDARYYDDDDYDSADEDGYYESYGRR